MDMGVINDFVKLIKTSAIYKLVISLQEAKEEITLELEAENLLVVAKYLKESPELKLHMLMDICGCDYPQRQKRFEVVYQFLSLTFNKRITLKIKVAEGAIVPSLKPIFKSAGWFEREVWDMYGIMFRGHDDLRKILTDYGFQGHPLRKDYPLTGYTEVRYDVAKKTVVSEPVELVQDFRNFDFASPWSGTDYVLPGDEKAS
jgi:NADH-quinone oxidoreductase subunit C